MQHDLLNGTRQSSFFKEMLPFVVEALGGMSRWKSNDTRKSATQLLGSTLSCQFLLSMVVLESVTAILLPVSQALQQVGLDITGIPAIFIIFVMS